MSNHTKGPWMSSAGRALIFSPTHGNIAEVYAPNSLNDVKTNEEAKANACLIAAAPELLEALEAMLVDYANTAACVREGCDCAGNEYPKAIARAARAAIAKARGEEK